ncbi:hypothetical protein CTI14_06190 [Methylobacterium radiotolerans]|nr:hypothetical protein CTI14_06190 [Methylobacterium radiotolerans]
MASGNGTLNGSIAIQPCGLDPISLGALVESFDNEVRSVDVEQRYFLLLVYLIEYDVVAVGT